jgi:hypothetical protein
MYWWQTIVVTCFLAGCTVTEPVAIITKNGQILRGTATASLSGGSFIVTDGPLSCSGTYDSMTGSTTISMKVLCSDGRTGLAMVTRDKGLQSGSGRVRLSDGTEADFVIGSGARILRQSD